MNQSRFPEAKSGSHVPCHAKVCILIILTTYEKNNDPDKGVDLINGTGDKAGHSEGAFKLGGKARGESGSRLHGREGALADVIRHRKAKDRFDLVIRRELLDLKDSGV